MKNIHQIIAESLEEYSIGKHWYLGPTYRGSGLRPVEFEIKRGNKVVGTGKDDARGGMIILHWNSGEEDLFREWAESDPDTKKYKSDREFLETAVMVLMDRRGI